MTSRAINLLIPPIAHCAVFALALVVFTGGLAGCGGAGSTLTPPGNPANITGN